MVGRRLLLAVLSLGCVLGCAPPPPDTPIPLWDSEVETARVDPGWIEGVPLGGTPLSVDLRSIDAPLFRGIVFPAAGGASLHIDLDGTRRTVDVTEAQALELDVDGVERLTLESTGDLWLWRPRLTHRDLQGRRTVVVMADTLRADHADAVHMPQLHGYLQGADQTLHFDRAFSPAPWTLPSLASVFTGRPTSELRTPDGTLIAIPPGHPTLAERLRDQGLTTVALVANYTVNHENGFSRGFQLFDAPVPGDHASEHGADSPSPDASWIVERARQLVEWLPDVDLFLYLQFMDPHDPYRHHERGGALHAPRSGAFLLDARLEALRDAYASEVAHMDRQLGALLDDLEPMDTLVFTADHGEEFFDHGGFRHGPTLFDATVRVPLIVHGADLESGRFDTPVTLRGLGDFLVARTDPQGAERTAALEHLADGRTPTSETFSHGPPRFSVALDDQRILFAARALVDTPPKHPVEAWLRTTQPAIRLANSEDPVDPALARRALRHLVEHYEGFRHGVYAMLEPGAELSTTLDGVDDGGFFWGHGSVETRRSEGGSLALEARADEPFLLIFVPLAQGANPELPEEPPDGVRLWLDPGRSVEELGEHAETLERLRSLGYL